MLLQIYFSFVLAIFRDFLSRLHEKCWVLLTQFPGFLITELSCGGLLQELSLRLGPRPSWAPWGGVWWGFKPSVWCWMLRKGSACECCSSQLGWCGVMGWVSSQRWWGCCSAFPSRINRKLVGNMELCRIWAVLTHKIYAFSPWLFPQKWEKHLQGKPILFVNFLI